MSTITIEQLDLRDAREVDRYVQRHPQGSPFHETRWLELVRATFQFETQTLIAREDGRIAGVLPLALVTAPITGRRLVSVPFGVYGGVLAENEDVAVRIDHAGCELAKRLGARYLELRYLGEGCTHHESASIHETYRKELPSDPDEVLGTIPRKARAEVRKARNKFGLEVREDPALFDEFYRLYVLNKRSLGSPVFRPSYFRRLLDLYGIRAMLHGVYDGDQVLAAVLSLESCGVLYPYYSGAEPGIAKTGANNAMYAGLMEDAVRRGCHTFDFGRSRVGSGPAKFKQHMGFEATPLDYQFFFPRGGTAPKLNPSNPKMALPKRILGSLPVWAAQLVGPSLMRHVP